jgi:alkanesulfonate monooxygenase SsuD/methylene tetrahydromethanopterin reductase-like flavin-dependent oxidoreductase (luciferase family)
VDTTIQLRFDLRILAPARTTFAEQHRACLEMSAWADDIGADSIMVSEHHGDPAGFTCAPIVLAASILGRTVRIPVSIAAILAPLHDPVRLAEQLATLDCLAPGRVSVVVGGGYRRPELVMAGVLPGERGRLIEEFVAVCRAAWSGEPFQWRGRSMLVTPPPATPGGPALFAGGKTVLAARRAARLRCPFYPATTDPAVTEAYRAECERLGFPAGRLEGPGVSLTAPSFVMLSKDPEETWESIGPIALADATTYAAWQEQGIRSAWSIPGLEGLDALRATNRYMIVTPDECLAMIHRDRGLILHPLMGGIPPAEAWASLRLFEHEVLPHLSR